MKFSVGYQIDKREMFVSEIIKRREQINEVYFAFGDFANGRHRSTRDLYLDPETARERQLSELMALSDAGISLNLLLNANCYGADSLARSFYEKIGDTVDYFAENFSLTSVTTTSPIIAKFIKDNFPALDIRSSINMEIGTPAAMDYIKEYYDSFYLRRELNRDIEGILRAKKWCEENGKKMYMLANSGCLNYCPVHNFHDNLVAHEEEIMSRDNAFEFHSVCKKRLQNKETAVSLLRDSNFVRPEDIHLYDGLFEAAKLATRVNPNPTQILRAYTTGKYIGNLAELLEPDHSSAIAPYILENTLIPQDFAERVMKCDKNCDKCRYCDKIFQKALKKYNEGVFIYANE
ncbi:MAG: hypothetical protein IKT56_05970 [Clostridia bacterium]|nr:hypothetical protein [Clostridia bacterium]